MPGLALGAAGMIVSAFSRERAATGAGVAARPGIPFNTYGIGAGFPSLRLANTWAVILGRVLPGRVLYRRHGNHGRQRHHRRSGKGGQRIFLPVRLKPYGVNKARQ